MGAETTNMGTVTRSLSEIVTKLREDAHELDSPFYTKTPEQPGWEYVAKAFLEVAAEIAFAAGIEVPTVCECGKEAVRNGRCEEHKVNRRRGSWYSDRRRLGSTDTPPSCGNGACRSEIQNGETVTRHDLRCPDRGPENSVA